VSRATIAEARTHFLVRFGAEFSIIGAYGFSTTNDDDERIGAEDPRFLRRYKSYLCCLGLTPKFGEYIQ